TTSSKVNPYGRFPLCVGSGAGTCPRDIGDPHAPDQHSYPDRKLRRALYLYISASVELSCSRNEDSSVVKSGRSPPRVSNVYAVGILVYFAWAGILALSSRS